jgi:hypothetical protein
MFKGESKMPNYSAHGSHIVDNRLRVYHQSGLDTYRAFYAILNLVNFPKFEEDPSHQDFIGANECGAFRRFIVTGSFRSVFPETPFGDEGMEALMLAEALSRALLQFNLRGKLMVEEDQFLV